jgi:hypothetical protein
MVKLATTLVQLVVILPLLAKAFDFQKSLEHLRGRTPAVVDGSGEAGTKSLPRGRKLEEYSFRLGMHGIETEDWCIECEYHGVSGSQCYEGDKLVIDKCGTSLRQWFVYEEAEPGIGRLKPQGSPNLCLTLDGHSIRLIKCNDDNEGQIFLGFDPVHPFELYPEGMKGDCLTQMNHEPTKDQEILVMECVVARDDLTSRWQVQKAKGEYASATDTKSLISNDETSNDPNIKVAFASAAVTRNNQDDDGRDDDGQDDDGRDDDGRYEESCPDICLDVFQENNSIGEFQPISTDYSVETLYGYNSDNYSFNGDDVVPLLIDYSILFIHQDIRPDKCDLSLVIVHDSKEECTGGEVRMFITGDLEDSVVQDGRDSPSDTYIYTEETGETECFWEWGWQSDCDKRTDGIAHYWPSGKDCISVSAEFIRGIDEWQFVPGPVYNDGSADPSDYIYLRKSKKLQICKREC